MSELIASLIQETIDADQAVTADYLQEIKAYAFDDPDSAHPKLKTVSFEMTDEEGRRQQVTIPVLSLLPLPVLHISEATFDIDTQVTYVEQVFKSKEDILNELKYRSGGRNISKEDISKNLLKKSRSHRLIQETEDGNFKICSVLVRPTNTTTGISAAPTAESNENDDESTRQTFNARIHVKLEQSVLPSGMRGLLQETDRTITTEYI